MKKTLFSLGLCLISSALSLQAQSGDRLRFGIEAGYTINNFTNSNRYCRLGGFVGVRAEYDHNQSLYFAGGLRFISKGTDSLNGYDGAADDYYTPSYIEMPLSVGIYKQYTKRLRIFAETGPYLAIGVGGRYAGSYSDMGPEYYKSWDYHFFSKGNGNPRRFDPGWGARVGFRCKHVNVSVGYEIGFCTLAKGGKINSDLSDMRNSSFNVGLTYLFY